MHRLDTVALLHSCFLFSALSRALDHIPNAFALAQACHKTDLHLTLCVFFPFFLFSNLFKKKSFFSFFLCFVLFFFRFVFFSVFFFFWFLFFSLSLFLFSLVTS